MFSLSTLLVSLLTLAPLHSVPTGLEAISGLYTGTLTYLDYSSGEVAALELVSNVYFDGPKLHLRHLINEGGGAYDQHYIYKFGDDQVTMEGKWDLLESQTNGPDGAFRLVMERSGKDGNERRPCIFQTTFSGTPEAFLITKKVRFVDEADFFIRNQYRFTRLPETGPAAFE